MQQGLNVQIQGEKKLTTPGGLGGKPCVVDGTRSTVKNQVENPNEMEPGIHPTNKRETALAKTASERVPKNKKAI